MFAYCGNNPVIYADPSGSILNPAINSRYQVASIDGLISGAGGGSGASAVISIVVFDALSRAYRTVSTWIEEQQEAIKDKLSKSLAIATTKTYRTEYEKHHIAARRSPNAAAAATILNQVLPLGVEDPQNLVYVKTSVHRRLHTTLYYTFANQIIIDAYNSANGDALLQYSNVVKALGILRDFITALNILSIN